jgi:peptidoglycan/LPS O-acetylase OafA/YrhL
MGSVSPLEMQFYLLLPLIAAGIALFVGTTGSVLRLGSAVLAVMLAGLSARGAFAFRDSWLPLLPGVLRAGANLLLPLTFGTVGKFLEVFALGMLCSVLYLSVAHHELHRLTALRARLLSPILLICGLSVYLVIAYAPGVQLLLQAAVVNLHGSQQFLLAATGFEFSVGSAYSLILLSILWSRGLLRAIFEWAPLRFVGLVSYSLYLWHLPIMLWVQNTQLRSAMPANARLLIQLVVGLGVAIPVAYLSYQLVERPFLKRRNRLRGDAVQAPLPSMDGMPCA